MLPSPVRWRPLMSTEADNSGLEHGRASRDLDDLVPIVYDRLRSLARSRLSRSVSGDSLQATGLVHEVYLRLANEDGPTWADPEHFFAVAVQAMRWILVDRARFRGRQCRQRNRAGKGVPVDELPQQSPDDGWDHEALELALGVLERTWPQKARVVMLRYLAGLSVEDTAKLLGISTATVKRDWRFARAWLCRRMFDRDPDHVEVTDG